MTLLDAIVVGAGPAGAAVAARLHQHGLRDVLVLDRYAFPREKPCGGGLTGHVGHVGQGVSQQPTVDGRRPTPAHATHHRGGPRRRRTTTVVSRAGISRRTVQYRVREWGLSTSSPSEADSDVPPSELERDVS